MWRVIILIAVSVAGVTTKSCVKRRSESTGDEDGHYCVCNATYCDTTPHVFKPRNLERYFLITSNKDGLRFHVSSNIFRNFTPNDFSSGKISVNRRQRYQDIIGFGGALTDSASFNIFSLSKHANNNLMKSYFGPGGIEYSMIRMPMACSDFSWRPYSYLMDNDTSLSNFSLTREDNFYKIPIVKKALRMRNGKIKLLTLPWSPSSWMKTDNTTLNENSLRPEYRRVWADYFVKYLEAYQNNSIEFWALSIQNEPASYLYTPFEIYGLRMTSKAQANFLVNYLSPALKKAGFGHIKILIGEEQRQFFPEWAEVIFQNQKARNETYGIAVHWYYDHLYSPNILDKTKELFPEKYILYTEACTGLLFHNYDKRVVLGSWLRGERYAQNIIETTTHFASSWIDWNIALDLTGGPNWQSNFVDSPIIVNASADEFYKQPMFYVLGHFSKYVPPGSVRISSTLARSEGIDSVAFFTPDNATVLVILNRNEVNKKILIEDFDKGTIKINVTAKSINTIKYW
ncbi:lysosomal acid glucosylceramidase-like [Odontomachus brunneus]|uniref:lysosomal acid glucosylceramidase-like n=1 Tax=Odontomachus brunneus TaxID=486640 RepID=UPI0013F24F3E|nr:lysosomal acid glucosylceramidase-like [Odontomachus brunneus]